MNNRVLQLPDGFEVTIEMNDEQTNLPLEEPVSIDADPDYLHSLDVRNRMREQLEADVAAYLRSGGNISRIDDNVRADPPRRPEARYGRRSI